MPRYELLTGKTELELPRAKLFLASTNPGSAKRLRALTRPLDSARIVRAGQPDKRACTTSEQSHRWTVQAL